MFSYFTTLTLFEYTIVLNSTIHSSSISKFIISIDGEQESKAVGPELDEFLTKQVSRFG